MAGIALGVGRGLSSLQMFIVGIGLLFGFVWASGFTQLLARDPLRVHLEGDDVTAGLLGFRVIGIAGVTLLLLGVVIGGIILVFAPAMLGLILWGMGFCIAIAFFWLLVNVLFVFDLAPWTLLATLIAFVGMILGGGLGICHRNPLVCPFLGIILADLALFLVASLWWLFKRRRSASRLSLPPWQLMLVNQSGYLLYGFTVMLLVVTDRLVAWLVGSQTTGLPRLSYYEIGLGWALLVFLVIIAVQEQLLRRLLQQIHQWAQRHDLAHMHSFTSYFQFTYWKSFGITILVAIFSGVGLLLILAYLEYAVDAFQFILPQAEGCFVFRWGIVGYGMLAVAMLNLGLMIVTAHPAKTLLFLLVALCVDVGVAWESALSFGYGASIMGLVAAAGVLLLLSSLQVSSLLRSASYLFYSSG